MREQLGEFERRGARVLIISFGTPEQTAHYKKMLDLPFPVASDPSAAAYRAFGLESGSLWQLWHPRVLLLYASLLWKGLALRRPDSEEDLAQLGGDFVLDADRRIVFAHRSRRPDVRPSVAQILASIPTTHPV